MLLDTSQRGPQTNDLGLYACKTYLSLPKPHLNPVAARFLLSFKDGPSGLDLILSGPLGGILSLSFTLLQMGKKKCFIRAWPSKTRGRNDSVDAKLSKTAPAGSMQPAAWGCPQRGAAPHLADKEGKSLCLPWQPALAGDRHRKERVRV